MESYDSSTGKWRDLKSLWMLLLLLGIALIKRLAFGMPPGSKEITALNNSFDTLNGRRQNQVEATAGAGAKGGVRTRVG